MAVQVLPPFPERKTPASCPNLTMAAYTLLFMPTAISTLLIPLDIRPSIAALLTLVHVAPIFVLR